MRIVSFLSMGSLYSDLMCGRYYLSSTPDDVAALFGVDVRDNFPPRYNIAPTEPVALIRMNERRQREYALARWGFIPEWAKGDHLERFAAKPLFNARAETAGEKPTFRNAFRRRRCLFPADGFYEWRTEGRKKLPHRIEAGGLMALAGVWETAVGPDGGEIDTAAILTVDAGPDVAPIKHREPVMIAPEYYALWLEADERDAGALGDLLRPSAAGTWTATAVEKAGQPPRAAPVDLLSGLEP